MQRSYLRASYIALTIAATGAAAATFQSCRTPGTSGLRETVPDGPEYSGIKLKMTGDDATGRITASFSFDNSEFNPGDSVELRYDVVRSLVEPKINCSALRGKATVKLAGTGKTGFFEKVVDRKLFDMPYRPDPQQMAKADMDLALEAGGELRVEGCLMKPGSGKALASDAAEPSGGLNLDESGPPIVQYGRICAERLGEIPITVTDETGTTTKAETRVNTCDYPIYLPTGTGGYCKPWARIGHLKISEDVSAAVVCRRYWTPGKPPPSGVNDPVFNDVAIIQHNRRTGETCWFQALGTLYAGRVPPPTEMKVPEEVLVEHPQATSAESF